MTTTLRILLVLMITLSLGAALVAADDNDSDSKDKEEQLSPYWGEAISQWSWWIIHWARERELDPDLVAAIVRQESIGQASAEGPYGAVGLMMVLSAQASGLSWRPTVEELKQPDVNLRWGTGMLKEIVRQADGNLVQALAAYNGGWDQLDLVSTEHYAHTVLNWYAYAIAARHGYGHRESEVWTMVIVTQVDGQTKLIQTETSGHFLAPCFDGTRQLEEIYPEIASAPRARVTHFVDEDGHDVFVDLWLFVGGLDRHVDDLLAGTTLPTLVPLTTAPE
jgi:hypothetical protein